LAGVLARISRKPFAVVGHRGAAGRFPENTLKSIEYAIAAGADVVEVDVRATRDGRLIVFHDPDLKRLFNRSERVRDLEYAWIRSNLLLGGEPIPLLEEVLETVRDRVGLFIEVKEPDTTSHVVELVKRYGVVKDTAIISFYDEALVRAREVEPQIATGLIYAKPPGRVLDAKRLGASIVLPHYSIATEKANSLAHKLGLRVVAWTVNDTDTAVRLVKSGVDAIATDLPDALIELRRRLA